MFVWLFPTPVEPVTVIDPNECLVRNAHCDGSVAPGMGVPRDLSSSEASGALHQQTAPDVTLCLGAAWAVHTATPLPPVLDILTAADPPRGSRAHGWTVPTDDVEERWGWRVTTRLRTAFDLARLAPLDVAAQALLDSGFSRDAFDRFVAARPDASHAQRARQLSFAVLR